MINIEQYINSGIIEHYCLGLASEAEAAELEQHCHKYEEIRIALEQHQAAMENYIGQYEKKAPNNLLAGILTGINHDQKLADAKILQESGKLQQFIPISTQSDYQKWLDLTKDLKPPENFDVHLHELYNDSKNFLYVVWIKDQIPEEEHDDLHESILLLEGNCDGFLENRKVHLKEGDFWQVPLHTDHFLRVTSKQAVKLILMRQIVA